MRLGLYPAELAEGSIAAELYGATEVVRAPPPPLRGEQPLPRPASPTRASSFSGTVARPPPRRVRRAAARRAPVLHRDAGAPRAALAARTDAHPLFRGLVGAALERQQAQPAVRGRRRWLSGRADAGELAPRRARRAEVLEPPSGSSTGKVWDVRRETVPLRRRRASCASTSTTRAPSRCSRSTTRTASLLIQQYRHPIRTRDWEIPAGLLDVDGRGRRSRPRSASSRRRPTSRRPSGACSPSSTRRPAAATRSIRIYLARGLTATAAAFAREAEEADIERAVGAARRVPSTRVLARRRAEPVADDRRARGARGAGSRAGARSRRRRALAGPSSATTDAAGPTRR